MADLHVAVLGHGPDVVVLSGGPGCVNYLALEELTPRGMRAWCPDPRGVGRSAGGPHSMAEAVADLETLRRSSGVDRWVVLGHSWGGDLAVRYALDHPESVSRVVAIAGTGIQKDRTWQQTYESLRDNEPDIPIEWVPAVHEALSASFTEWIHEPDLFRRLADSPVPMAFLAAEHDIRPSWPLQQLAALVPHGSFEVVPGVPHDFWSTHTEMWSSIVTRACG